MSQSSEIFYQINPHELELLRLQLIAPIVEGSSHSLEQLINFAEQKSSQVFGDHLDLFQGILEPISDSIELNFNKIDTISPQTLSKLEILGHKLELEPKIWQVKNIDLLQHLFKAADIKQTRQNQRNHFSKIDLLTCLLHKIHHTELTDESPLETMKNKLH